MEETKKTVLITIAMKKGGVGKTGIAFNFSHWLAIEKNKNVLCIDMDENCNFSQVMNIYDQQGTVANILKGKGDVKIHKITDNIDLIAGFNRLDDVQEDIARSEQKTMMLYMWLDDNYKPLNLAQYDYIVIDTHNDFATATKNAIAVSDVMFAPIIPVNFSDSINIEARLDEFRSEVIDYRTRQSLITTDLKLIGNMIKHNTSNSHQFKEYIKNNEKFIAAFPFKEIFNKSIQYKKPISELIADPKTQSDKEFKEEFDENMSKMYEVVKQYK
ncbi:ParA family protein [Staphylococcus simulans]